MPALLVLVLALASMSTVGIADELEEWCTQVQKASSIVICSDSELRQQAIARNKLFEAARERLSPEKYKALTQDQSQWIKSYTARCGISVDDPPPVRPVPQLVIDCYKRESLSRTAYLSRLIFGSAPIVTESPKPPASLQNAAIAAWYDCLYEAADALADQPEPARTVADAAFGGCSNEEVRYKAALGERFDWDFVAKIKSEVIAPKVLARVMVVRAARAKLRKEIPDAKPAIDLNRM